MCTGRSTGVDGCTSFIDTNNRSLRPSDSRLSSALRLRSHLLPFFFFFGFFSPAPSRPPALRIAAIKLFRPPASEGASAGIAGIDGIDGIDGIAGIAGIDGIDGTAAAGAAAVAAAGVRTDAAEDGPCAGAAVVYVGFVPATAVMGPPVRARTGAALGPAARREMRWYRPPPCCRELARLLDAAFAAPAAVVVGGLRCRSYPTKARSCLLQ